MSKVTIPLIERYERQKAAIADLERRLEEAETVQAELQVATRCALDDRDSAIKALDEIGKGRGKAASLAREKAQGLRERAERRHLRVV